MKPIPLLSEIFNSLGNDLRNRLDLTDSDLRKVVDAFAAVEAANLKLLYLFLADIQKNQFPDTADTVENGGELERFGLIHLNRQINPATSGIYTAQVFGTVGSVIRNGLTFKSNDDSNSPGKLFTTDAETILGAGDNFVQIRALEAGINSDLIVSNNLTITEPVIGVVQTVTITAIVTASKAAESVDIYRQLIIDAIQLEPQGGARTDYRLWASDAQGVRRVYASVKQGEPGTVQVFVEATETDSTDGFGTPPAALLTEVANVIQLDPDVTKPADERGRRPIQANIETLAITLKPVDVTITGLNEDTTAIRTSIQAALKTFLKDIRPFVSGSDLARNKNDVLFSARFQSVISDTLSSTNFFTVFTMSVDGNVVNSFTFSGSNIPFLRNIIYN